MPDATGHTLAAFALASLALIVIPGPGVIYVVTRSVEHGLGIPAAFSHGRPARH